MGKRIKRIICLLMCYLLPVFLPAHEFWLQPEKFICKRGETINIRFWLGENFQGENWGGNASRVNSLKIYMGGATDDLSPQLSNERGDSLQLAMFDEGTAMITFNSTNAFIKLEASQFNAYLKEDGLINAIDFRQKNKLEDSPGKELYQRSVKTLIQVGSAKNDCFKQPTDLPLDIIPKANPYTLKNNQRLALKILYKKKPLANYSIKLWHRINNSTIQQNLTTDQKGEINFSVHTAGKWMVSTIRISHLDNNPQADWQSYWGSLTWGY